MPKATWTQFPDGLHSLQPMQTVRKLCRPLRRRRLFAQGPENQADRAISTICGCVRRNAALAVAAIIFSHRSSSLAASAVARPALYAAVDERQRGFGEAGRSIRSHRAAGHRDSNGASPAADANRGSVCCDRGLGRCRGSRIVSVLRPSRAGVCFRSGGAYFGGPHAGDLCHPGCGLATGDGLLARRARTGSERCEAALVGRTPGVVRGGPGHTLHQHGSQRCGRLVVRRSCVAGNHLDLGPCCPGTRRRPISAYQRPSWDTPRTRTTAKPEGPPAQ
jgi:hypothetical protein